MGPFLRRYILNLEWLVSFMKWWNMLFQVALYRATVVTDVTLEWLFSFMNRCNMSFHGTLWRTTVSAVFSGGAGGARAPPEFGGSGKGRSLISAFWSLAITTNTPGFKKLNTALKSAVCSRKKMSIPVQTLFKKRMDFIYVIYVIRL